MKSGLCDIGSFFGQSPNISLWTCWPVSVKAGVEIEISKIPSLCKFSQGDKKLLNLHY